MSYEIIYDKQFIKINDNLFVPMIHAGSNNCTEMSQRERRARSWYVYNIGKTPFLTKEEMLEHCAEERLRIKEHYEKDGTEYNDDMFGYWSGLAIGCTTNKVTFGNYKGIFLTGMRKAVTVETLLEWNINTYILTYSYHNSGYNGLEPLRVSPKTSEELVSMYNDAVEKYKNTDASIYISIDSWAERQVPRMRKALFGKAKHTKKHVEVDGYWTLKVQGKGTYFVRAIKYGYRYSWSPYLKFETEKQAERKAKQIKKCAVEVEYIKEKETIYA